MPVADATLPAPKGEVGCLGEHSRAFWEAIDITLNQAHSTSDRKRAINERVMAAF